MSNAENTILKAILGSKNPDKAVQLFLHLSLKRLHVSMNVNKRQ